MWAWFKRLFRIGASEAHAALDSLENPIKMTEQGIRELKENQEKALIALAEVKAMGIRAKGDAEAQEQKANEYQSKALALLQKAKAGELDQAEADRLASEALLKKQANMKLADESKKNQAMFEGHADKLSANLETLRSNISNYENELKTLKARAKVSAATRDINRDLANIDSSSTVAMLEKMKDKVAEQEALSESYGEIAHESRSVDEEIEAALGGSEAQTIVKDDLEALKAQLS
jgi:phage shock protein A